MFVLDLLGLQQLGIWPNISFFFLVDRLCFVDCVVVVVTVAVVVTVHPTKANYYSVNNKKHK